MFEYKYIQLYHESIYNMYSLCVGYIICAFHICLDCSNVNCCTHGIVNFHVKYSV